MINHLTEKTWSMIGFIVLVLLGFFSHDMYRLSGNSLWCAAFFPVNESIWEHLKLGNIAVICWAVVEYFLRAVRSKKFFGLKFAGLIALNLSIVLIFYGYSIPLGRNIVIVDILSYVIAAAVCQIIIFKGSQIQFSWCLSERISMGLFVIYLLMFAYFTFDPPTLGIFMEHHSGSYGIPDLNQN